MSDKKIYTLGIDAGTLSVKMAYSDGVKVHRVRKEHYGEPSQVFRQILKENGLERHLANSFSTGKYAGLLSADHPVSSVSPDSVLLTALNQQHFSGINYAIDIGYSGLAMAELRDGSLHRYETNSLCAAGTGAFLDQQMLRLGLTYQQIGDIPVVEHPPSIASRCAVFAKSDLIHRQQAGYSIAQLWNGLVKGLAQAAFSSLFRGTKIDSDLLIIGGLAKNKIFLHYFEALLDGHRLLVPSNPDFFLAEALRRSAHQGNFKNNGGSLKNHKQSQLFEKPLTFSDQQVQLHRHFVDDQGNEVDLYHLPEDKTLEVFAGVDIGSTSTKLVLVDPSGRLCLGMYTRTQGNPVKAFQRLLHGTDNLCNERSVRLHVCGLGTTGSGRKLVGAFAGADIIKNEITAHLKGAVKEFPDVRTIFEIGGQDSKYISVENGWMKDANMNYVCAAGTGSFLEEQARNLDIALDKISTYCKGALPPNANHRCTVFMEQDANQLLTKGMKKSQVMASILYAVCKNYLHRVVHHRPVKEPILFLGATAKNKGLVEAFQNVLKKKVHVSPYSHLMGAIGMAEMLREKKLQVTEFRGFGIKDLQLQVSESICAQCHNECRISHLLSDRGKSLASWGYQCGREPGNRKAQHHEQLKAFRQMDKVIHQSVVPENPDARIYMPHVLHFYAYNPFWQHFFNALGIALITVPGDNQVISNYASKYALTDCCFPVKLAAGRVIYAMEHHQSPVFLPYHIQDQVNPKASNSFFCPLSQAFPSVLKSTLNIHGLDTDQVLTPVVDYSKDDNWNIRELMKVIGKRFRISRKEIGSAWNQAKKGQEESNRRLLHNRHVLTSLAGTSEKPVFVLIGRSYNLMDELLNLDLPKTIARYGYDVVPIDMLPIDRKDLPSGYQDMYWSYGQKIVVACRYILNRPGIYPIFLTNFNCGPDSFLLSVFEKEMGDKPSLILELDEHGGDGGYITRVEAFFDRVENHFQKGGVTSRREDIPESRIVRSLSDYKVYIPPMHPIASRLMSAALRGYGIDSVALEKEDSETYGIGSACVRGSECMPAASTIGSFIYQIRKEEKEGNLNGRAALFMPCTDGPCRFGQYVRLHEKILQSQNLNATIISPNSDDNYSDISGSLRKHLFKALMVSDILDKLIHKIRPYEKEKGETDMLAGNFTDLLTDTFENKGNITGVLKQLYTELITIERDAAKKPLVGVVGEIYVRNSPYSNANLVDTIERCGGEAWVAPIMEWLHYTSGFEENSGLWDYLRNKLTNGVVSYFENRYMAVFGDMLKDRREPSIKAVRRYGKTFLPDSIEGESILTLGRAIAFMHQGADAVVNVSPFGCMPGSISTSILKDVSKQYGVPVISLFYDGEADFSGILETYIRNSR